MCVVTGIRSMLAKAVNDSHAWQAALRFWVCMVLGDLFGSAHPSSCHAGGCKVKHVLVLAGWLAG